MRCPICGAVESKVIDSRPSDNYTAIRRRRQCEACGHRFTTYERREEQPLVVIKRNGAKEPFDREKLMRGLVRATVKRGIDIERLDQLIDEVEGKVRDSGMTEVRASDLGEMVLRSLLDLDRVAYVRFASVYRHFDDVEEFSDELRRLASERKAQP